MYVSKQNSIIGLSVYLGLLIVSCSNPQTINTLSNTSVNDHQVNNRSISGKVEFPEKFKTKATQNDLTTKTTVSMYYPSTSTKANEIVATGFTKSDAGFVINFDSAFTPSMGEIFILEASKRLNGTGNDSLSLRTLLKWNGTSFDSITSSGIYINTKRLFEK